MCFNGFTTKDFTSIPVNNTCKTSIKSQMTKSFSPETSQQGLASVYSQIPVFQWVKEKRKGKQRKHLRSRDNSVHAPTHAHTHAGACVRFPGNRLTLLEYTSCTHKHSHTLPQYPLLLISSPNPIPFWYSLSNTVGHSHVLRIGTGMK